MGRPASSPQQHRLQRIAWSLVLCSLLAASCHAINLAGQKLANVVAPAAVVAVNVDLGAPSVVSPQLYGIFFEEIDHGGDGALYAELVQDRSFEALALAQTQQGVPGVSLLLHTWLPLGNTIWALSTDGPITPSNPHFLRVTVGTPRATGGMINQGYWGIAVAPGQRYFASLWVRVKQGSVSTLSVQLASADGNRIYASTPLSLAAAVGQWAKVSGYLSASNDVSDSKAILAVTFQGSGTLDLDVVSLFPAENVPVEQNPFRFDVLNALKALRPKFFRFPGGVYVEGAVLANAFEWKEALDGAETRPGHMNDKWSYWCTAGLGLYEYMLLNEQLGAEAIWVINAGIARQNSVTMASGLQHWIDNALDGIQFITGAATTTWGAVRARMGHPAPWTLDYVAIGNENCGMNNYVQNYKILYDRIRAQYPTMKLIGNCRDIGSPQDMYDFHNYTYNADVFYDMRTMFQQFPSSPRVFASEYAVRTGDLRGALAESAYMMGMEATNGLVQMAAYAPLICNVHDKTWSPTAIIVDSRSVLLTPSYWVQQLFAQYTGPTYYATTTTTADPRAPVMVMASGTCVAEDCSQLAVKMVNYDSIPKQVTVSLQNLQGAVKSQATLITLTSGCGGDQNDFSAPQRVNPVTNKLTNVAATNILQMPPWSLMVLVLDKA